MIRYGLLALLGVLALAAPARAGGDRSPVARAESVRGAARGADTPPPVTTSIVQPTRPPLATTTPFKATTQPFPASRAVSAPLPESLTAVPEARHRGDGRHRHREHVTTVFVGPAAPQITVVQQPVYYQAILPAPSQCVSPGYWIYRWVPYTTTQTVWVQGSWGSDGTWIDSHWETRPYSSGYYDPVWVPGQAYAC